MAKGSQKHTRANFNGETHCAGCGKKLTVSNFGHIRTVFPSNKTDVFCSSCVEQQVRDSIAMTRESLGLDPFT